MASNRPHICLKLDLYSRLRLKVLKNIRKSNKEEALWPRIGLKLASNWPWIGLKLDLFNRSNSWPSRIRLQVSKIVLKSKVFKKKNRAYRTDLIGLKLSAHENEKRSSYLKGQAGLYFTKRLKRPWPSHVLQTVNKFVEKKFARPTGKQITI